MGLFLFVAIPLLLQGFYESAGHRNNRNRQRTYHEELPMRSCNPLQHIQMPVPHLSHVIQLLIRVAWTSLYVDIGELTAHSIHQHEGRSNCDDCNENNEIVVQIAHLDLLRAICGIVGLKRT